MENPQFDKDLFEIFANLINDEDEIEILRMLLEGNDNELIIKEYLKNLGDKSNDQD